MRNYKTIRQQSEEIRELQERFERAQRERAGVSLTEQGAVASKAHGAAAVVGASRDRVLQQEAILEREGIDAGQRVYGAGVVVNSIGINNFNQSSRDHAALDTARQGLPCLADALHAEQRGHRTVRMGGLWMDNAGRLVAKEEGWHVGLEDRGLAALINKCNAPGFLDVSPFPSGGQLMATLDPDVRALAFNRQTRKASDKALRKKVKLLTRVVRGTEEAFAVVGPRYLHQVNGEALVRILHHVVQDEGLADTLRVETDYNQETTRLRVTLWHHADHIVDPSCGDVYKVGVQIETKDDGTGGINVAFVCLRNLCRNLIIIGKGYKRMVRLSHRGARNLKARVQTVRQDLRVGVRSTLALMEEVLPDLGTLRATPIHEVFDVDPEAPAREQARVALGSMIDDEVVSLSALAELERMKSAPCGRSDEDKAARRDAAVEVLLSHWDREPGGSLMDVVNAMTSLHREKNIDREDVHGIEERVGELVPVLAARAAQ